MDAAEIEVRHEYLYSVDQAHIRALDLFLMKIQIDPKSALCGIIIGVLATFAIGAGTSPNQIGRFQTAGGGGFFLTIDTVTGKTWQAGMNLLPQYNPDFFEKKSGE